MRRPSIPRVQAVAFLALAAVAALLLLTLPGRSEAGGAGAQREARVCFPAAKWGPAPDRLRPCVRVTRVYEDGSFRFAVSDAGGTIRYTSAVGALDR